MSNSAIAAIFTTLGVVVLGVMASYVIARYDFRGRGLMYTLFAAGLMFPMTVAITPLYILIRGMGLMNSLAGLFCRRLHSRCPQPSLSWFPSCGRSPKSWKRPHLLTDPAGSGSSSAWWCRYQSPESSRPDFWRS